MIEIWKDISNYEGLYQVSNLGRVKSLARKLWNGNSFWTSKEKILKSPYNSGGYCQLCLRKDGATKSFRVHKLVQLAFCIPAGMIDHASRDKSDNRLDNLRSCTVSQNGINTEPYKGSSVFKGVSWNKMAKKWSAAISKSGKHHYLGRFKSEFAAAKAYNKAAKMMFGEYAYLNQIS